MTAVQPPILNLNRLRISSGWPSDFRMSMLSTMSLLQSDEVVDVVVGAFRDVPHQSDASLGCCLRLRLPGFERGERRLQSRRDVTSTDASDWPQGHGLRAPPPMGAQSVWCDVPPQRAAWATRPLIGQVLHEKVNHPSSVDII